MHVPGSGDKSPIFLPGSGPAVLCLHGFSSTPYETGPLAQHLSAAGCFVASPLIAGHGETAAILGKTRWQDWLASASAALERLRTESRRSTVAIAGFSMGGLLALRLARLYPDAVSALALMAPPLRLPRGDEIGIRLWRLLPWFLRQGRFSIVKKRGGSDVTDSKIRIENPALAEMPLAGVVELTKLAQVVRADLCGVAAPTLLVHGDLDRTVPRQSLLEIERLLGSAVVERLQLPRSGHLVGVDIERATFCATVGDFFTRHMHAGHERKP